MGWNPLGNQYICAKIDEREFPVRSIGGLGGSPAWVKVIISVKLYNSEICSVYFFASSIFLFSEQFRTPRNRLVRLMLSCVHGCTPSRCPGGYLYDIEVATAASCCSFRRGNWSLVVLTLAVAARNTDDGAMVTVIVAASGGSHWPQPVRQKRIAHCSLARFCSSIWSRLG